MMKGIFVFFLLAAISAQVFGTQGKSTKEDLPKNEGRKLNEMLDKWANSTIMNIKNMKKEGKCTEFGSKYVEAKRFSCLLKIRKCIKNTQVFTKNPNGMNIRLLEKLLEYARYYSAADLTNLFQSGLSLYNSEVMKNEEGTSTTDDCIHLKLNEFKLAMNNLTMEVQKCSSDDKTWHTSVIPFISDLLKAFDLIGQITETQNHYTEIWRTMQTIEGKKIEKIFVKAIDDLGSVTSNWECLRMAIGRLTIFRIAILEINYQCGSNYAMSISEKKISEMDGLIKEAISYEEELKLRSNVRILFPENEMEKYLEKLKTYKETLNIGAEIVEFNRYCFQKNVNMFESSVNEIFSEASKCSMEFSNLDSIEGILD